MSTLFDRPSFPVTLPDGRTCQVQRVGGTEYEAAAAYAERLPDSQLAYAAMMCFYGIADPKPESVEQVGALLSVRDIYYLMQRVEFRSDLRDDPDAPVVADDAEPVAEGTEADPLVDEFRVDPAGRVGVEDGDAVGGDAGGVPAVQVPAEPVRDGVAGGEAVHDRGGVGGGEAGAAS